MSATMPVEICRFSFGRPVEPAGSLDEVAVEEPLEIRVEGHSLAVVMRTPGHDRELAAGFLLSEGVIGSAHDIFDMSQCGFSGENNEPGPRNIIDVALVRPAAFDPAKLSRHVFSSASCGLCSKTTIAAVLGAPLDSSLRVHAADLGQMPGRLRAAQAAFERTGGLHACALFSAGGDLVELREDIGRHNALDKLVGHALLNHTTPLSQHVLVLSGRSSFEMMQKAYAAGIALVAAIGAPSSLAVELARQSGQTLIGFLRGASMNVYAGRWRITAEN